MAISFAAYTLFHHEDAEQSVRNWRQDYFPFSLPSACSIPGNHGTDYALLAISSVSCIIDVILNEFTERGGFLWQIM